jgi:hypothetical protein
VDLHEPQKHRPAYAILRVDTMARKDTPFQRLVTVKKVVLSEGHAKAECERLNLMNARKGCQYVVQLTELDERVAEDEAGPGV